MAQQSALADARLAAKHEYPALSGTYSGDEPLEHGPLGSTVYQL
jgi:hypothetical protein